MAIEQPKKNEASQKTAPVEAKAEAKASKPIEAQVEEFNVPANAIRGTLSMTAKAGEPNKKGLIRKQNMFEGDFGGMAISISAYSNPKALTSQEYEVILVPVKHHAKD